MVVGRCKTASHVTIYGDTLRAAVWWILLRTRQAVSEYFSVTHFVPNSERGHWFLKKEKAIKVVECFVGTGERTEAHRTLCELFDASLTECLSHAIMYLKGTLKTHISKGTIKLRSPDCHLTQLFSHFTNSSRGISPLSTRAHFSMARLFHSSNSSGVMVALSTLALRVWYLLR